MTSVRDLPSLQSINALDLGFLANGIVEFRCMSINNNQVRTFSKGSQVSDGGVDANGNIDITLNIDRKDPLYTGNTQSSHENEINMSEYTEELTIELPDLGEVEGHVAKWHKKVGDRIHGDKNLCDIETELFTFGMDAEDASNGILKEILVQEGEKDVTPGTPICTIIHKPTE